MVRLVSGVVLATAALAAILFLPLNALRGLAVLIAALAAHEYLQIAGIADVRRQAIAVAATIATCAGVAWQSDVQVGALVPLMALAWIAGEVLFGGSSIHDAAASAVAPLYIGLPLGMITLVHDLEGWRATLMLIATVIVSDSSQYYAGRTLGRHPLAPTISPKKTVEGAVGGLLGGTLFAMLAGHQLLRASTLPGLAVLGASVVVLGICGDLFESRLKRAAGMKDSSSLIPGHGGILDRIDALLFAAPAFYLYLVTVKVTL